MLMALQLSLTGSYLPPGIGIGLGVAVGVGGGWLGVGVTPRASGSAYLPAFSELQKAHPPHTVISAPVQTAVWMSRPDGAFVVLSAFPVSVLGSYVPPLLTSLLPSYPPQTTILLPVQMALWRCR